MKAKIGIAIVFFTVVGILAYSIYSRATHMASTRSAVAVLPDFEFRSLDGQKLTHRDIGKKPVLFTFFLTDCEYCQMEIENMVTSKESDMMDIWLISPEKDSILEAFVRNQKLSRFAHIKVVRDTSHLGGKTFGITTTPTSFLYSNSKNLIKRYNGAIRPEVVLRDLENHK